MKIQLLIATGENDYADHLSQVLSEKYTDVFEVSIGSSAQRLAELLSKHSFDVALLDPLLIAGLDLQPIRLPLLLWDGTGVVPAMAEALQKIRKYQRISTMIGAVLEQYAAISIGTGALSTNSAHVTAVWSPAGGVGKTTVALAYAAHKSAGGSQVLYLDLEHFSSTAVYFANTGKSISVAFEKIEGNVEILLRSIRQQDSASGIFYFGQPDNYDDMHVLTVEDLKIFIAACTESVEELVIDLPSVCTEQVCKVLDLANAVFLVSDSTKTAQVKLGQFLTQHNFFEHIQPKTLLVANKDAKVDGTYTGRAITLPYVKSGDAVAVYKTLSGHSFEA